MRALTPLLFLLGSRRAVEDAARHWRVALVVGALLVLSAGLARNYDGEDLLHEPQWLAAPFAASIVTSLVLFAVYWWLAPGAVSRSVAASAATEPLPDGELAVKTVDDTSRPGHRLTWRMYAPFLGLYWLTAPLAWLYGIPYEMLVSPSDAVTANAITLGVVSLWRVALMARVAHVLLGCSLWRAFVLDLWLGICGIVAASFCGPKPVLDVMGGLRLTEAEQRAGDLFGITIFFGGIAAIVLAIPALIAAAKISMPKLANARSEKLIACEIADERSRRWWPVVLIAILAVLAWIPALVVQQPKQRNRRIVEELVEQKRYTEAVEMMSDLTERDLPAPWAPPLGHPYARRDTMHALVQAINESPRRLPTFVRRGYLEWVGLASASVLRKDDWLAALETLTEDDAMRIVSNDESWDRAGSTIQQLEWMLRQPDVTTERQRAAIEHALSVLKAGQTTWDSYKSDDNKP